MTDPKRREQRRTHLDASVVPVERALLARADDLENRKSFEHIGGKPAAEWLAAELRALADELHYW